MVGLIGGLGGFVLPIAFGAMNDLTGIWTSCFMLLFLTVAVSLGWMHLAIRRLEKSEHPELRGARTCRRPSPSASPSAHAAPVPARRLVAGE